MNVALILRLIMLVGIIAMGLYFIVDCFKHKEDFKGLSVKRGIILGIIGLVANLLDTLGIGSFGPTTAAMKLTKTCEDEYIPGVLNVGDAFPVCFEAWLFIGSVDMDGLTLASMIIAAMLGAVIGVRILVGWDVKKIRLGMGVCLIILGVLMVMRQLGVGPFGVAGTALGLSGVKLVIACVVQFVLGALMMIGVGLYTPCIALCSIMGMNITAAFPVMMGSCAYLMIAGSFAFIKAGKYDRFAALMNATAGCVGVFLAYTIITNLPLNVLFWILVCVMFLVGFMMINDSRKTVTS
ncbi:putative membrane protein YfcA [Lachnospiraceae bacterium PF1-4]